MENFVVNDNRPGPDCDCVRNATRKTHSAIAQIEPHKRGGVKQPHTRENFRGWDRGWSSALLRLRRWSCRGGDRCNSQNYWPWASEARPQRACWSCDFDSRSFLPVHRSSLNRSSSPELTWTSARTCTRWAWCSGRWWPVMRCSGVSLLRWCISISTRPYRSKNSNMSRSRSLFF